MKSTDRCTVSLADGNPVAGWVPDVGKNIHMIISASAFHWQKHKDSGNRPHDFKNHQPELWEDLRIIPEQH